MTGTVARISLRVNPGAARSEVVGFTGSVLEVRVAAPPVKGKANRELVNILSCALSVSKAHITIVTGHTSRNKVVAVEGLSRDDIVRRLVPETFSSDGATE